MKKFKDIKTASYDLLLSGKSKRKFERFIFIVAFAGFFLHLGLILLANLGIIQTGGAAGLNNPIEALYTPFSIILFYEVYCLIYFLPKSITLYIGMQFEIMALIMIRAAFDEMSSLQLVSDIGEMFSQHNFLYLLATIIILFGLIYVFYRISQSTVRRENSGEPTLIKQKELPKQYFEAKRILALFMGALFLILTCISLYYLITGNSSIIEFVQNSKPFTRSFFSDIFTILIICDVTILLFSFAITDEFHRIMRNSGFVISTILLKLSFSIDGVASYLLIIVAAAFAIGILAFYKMYEKIELPEE
ncbi:MAG: hypothetical protein LBI15_04865 [Dysgonamonadaceae bacterium]|jgi:hypothetical protein|nr:hypothetical protein [Dysgonamonadaceae bacterium]